MMDTEKAREIRSLVMVVFRRWGGQWNVTVARAQAGDGWDVGVHSRRVVKGRISDRAADSLRGGEEESGGAWAVELRPIFDAAVEASKEI